MYPMFEQARLNGHSMKLNKTLRNYFTLFIEMNTICKAEGKLSEMSHPSAKITGAERYWTKKYKCRCFHSGKTKIE